MGKKICFLSEFCVSQYVEGTNRVSIDLAQHLISKGNSVSIIFPAWSYLNIERDRKQWDEMGVKLIPMHKPFLENPFFRAFWYFWHAFFFNLKESQDVFFGYYTASPALASSFMKFFFPEKNCFAGIWEPKTVEKISRFPFVKFFLSNLDGIESLSRTGMRQLVSAGLPEKKATFVYGHVDLKVFFPKEKSDSLLKKAGFSERDFIVLSVGRVSKMKGSDLLLEALRFCPEKVKIVFVGRILDDFPYIDKAREWMLEKRVFFAGYVPQEELPDYYHLSDLVCLPSLNEGFGIVFAEGFACGKPALASNVPPLPEVIGNAGELIPSSEPKSIAEKIQLFLDPKFYSEKKKSTLQTAKLYSKEKIMSAYYDFLMK